MNHGMGFIGLMLLCFIVQDYSSVIKYAKEFKYTALYKTLHCTDSQRLLQVIKCSYITIMTQVYQVNM